MIRICSLAIASSCSSSSSSSSRSYVAFHDIQSGAHARILGVRRTRRASELVHKRRDDDHDGDPPSRCGRQHRDEARRNVVHVRRADEILHFSIVAVVGKEQKRDGEIAHGGDEVPMRGMLVGLVIHTFV